MADTTLASQRTAPAPGSVAQVFKIATISSVQILVLVIAGTSGFIVSLLGLIIPDRLKGKPTTSRSRNRSTSPTASLSSRRSTSPSSLRRARGTESLKHPNHLKNAGTVSSSGGTTDTAKAWPMSRGNSATSTSTVPELGGGHSTSDASTSCSSSISDAARMHTSHPHSHHHHHGISANALYEGIVNRCKARKVSNQICKKHDTSTVITTSSVDEEKTSTSRRGSISAPAPSSSPLFPRPSHENIRSRLSSLMIPHSTHSNGNGHTSSKRRSLDGHMITELAQKSPTLLDETTRSATLPDATSATTTASSETSRISPIDKLGSKPPFLSRMFTFSSSSSSSSSSVDLKSASSASSLSSLSGATSLVTSSKGSSADASEVVRPRARRLSTRLVSFRSSSNNNNSRSSKSRRTISESENSHPASLSEESDQPTSQQFKEEEGMIRSPPQTPRLGSLPCTSASAAWTPGSNASPLRSPLSKRSFFGISNISPSKNHASSSSSPSGNNSNALTPRSNNAETQNGRKVSPNGKVERPTLGRRSASDTRTATSTTGVPGVAASSSSSWKNWMTSSPGKVQRRGTVSVSSAPGLPAILSTSTKEQGYETPVPGQGLPSSVHRAGGQSKHARHASDHSAALPSGVKEGRSLPLASMSPQTAQVRPRQSVSYRALSYAPLPSHAVLVPLSATGSTYSTNNNTQRQRIPHGNAQQQQQQRTSSSSSSSKPFVPYHPFLDERYHESSLDLSGTSGLTMEVHFNGGDDQQH